MERAHLSLSNLFVCPYLIYIFRIIISYLQHKDIRNLQLACKATYILIVNSPVPRQYSLTDTLIQRVISFYNANAATIISPNDRTQIIQQYNNLVAVYRKVFPLDRSKFKTTSSSWPLFYVIDNTARILVTIKHNIGLFRGLNLQVLSDNPQFVRLMINIGDARFVKLQSILQNTKDFKEFMAATEIYEETRGEHVFQLIYIPGYRYQVRIDSSGINVYGNLTSNIDRYIIHMHQRHQSLRGILSHTIKNMDQFIEYIDCLLTFFD